MSALIEVRRAVPSEYERVGALTIAAYSALRVDHLWGGYDAKILDTATRATHAEVLVATLDARIVGSVTYVGDANSEWSEATEPGEAQFRLLAVDPDMRGHGAGHALVQACVQRAETAGSPIVIHTTPWMESAHRIYEQFGFVRRPDRDMPYEAWHDERDVDLPAVWVGQAFLAYGWNPPG